MDDIIGTSYEAHNALADVTTLQAMITKLDIDHKLIHLHSFSIKWFLQCLTYLEDKKSTLPSFRILMAEKELFQK